MPSTPDLEWAVHVDGAHVTRAHAAEWAADADPVTAALGYAAKEAFQTLRAHGELPDDPSEGLSFGDAASAGIAAETIKRASPDDLVTIVLWFES